MESTKPTLTLSYSKMRQLSTCLYAYHIKYIRDIHPISTNKRIVTGSLFHIGIMSGEQSLKEACQQMEEAGALEDTAENVFSETLELVNFYRPYFESRFSFYSDESGLFTERELQRVLDKEFFSRFGMTLPEDFQYVLKGFVDALVIDKEDNQLYVIDFKMKSSFSPYNLDEEPQTLIYVYLLRLLGVDVAGSIIYSVRSKLPRKPLINKDGTVSRSSISTSWEIYKETILETGGDPDQYLDMKEKLSSYAPVQVDKSFMGDKSIAFVERNVASYFELAVNVHNLYPPSKTPPRNLGFNCTSCLYRTLCREEMYSEGSKPDYTYLKDTYSGLPEIGE